jgi:hypothetical protein
MTAIQPLTISAKDKARILSILNENLFFEVRAGKLLRNYNHLLRFSCAAKNIALSGYCRLDGPKP